MSSLHNRNMRQRPQWNWILTGALILDAICILAIYAAIIFVCG